MVKRDRNITVKIAELVENLLRKKGVRSAKVVLFGSYATHTERADSDIDLIIVSSTFRDKSLFERVQLTTGIGRTLVQTFKKPFDLMFYSDLEWEQSCSPVIVAAKQEGKILYLDQVMA